MRRPSYKELSGKLREAKSAVTKRMVALLEQDVIAEDAIDLEYVIDKELLYVLEELLNATTPKNYAGTRPPQKSYEREIDGLELFAFIVYSRRFRCRVYYKFALAKEVLWLVSLHQDRPLKEES